MRKSNQAFSLEVPEIFNTVVESNAEIRATAQGEPYSVEAPYLLCSVIELQSFDNASEGASLLEKYADTCVSSRYQAELVSRDQIDFKGRTTFVIKAKTDAVWQGQPLKFHYHFACIMLDNGLAIEFLATCEFAHAEKFLPLFETAFRSLEWQSDAVMAQALEAQIAKEEQAWNDTQRARELKKREAAEEKYDSLSFSPPDHGETFVHIQGFKADIDSEGCQWYLAQMDHRFYAELAMKIEDVDVAIGKKLLSDWKSDDGEVSISFYADNVYENGIPTGRFKLKNGKVEGNHQVDLQVHNFEYSLGFNGLVYLQDGWVGVDGWLQDEFNVDHKFRLQCYKKFDPGTLDWQYYRFSEKELPHAPAETVRHIIYEDAAMTGFPPKILECTHLKTLWLSGGTTEWQGTVISTYAPIKQIPDALGRLVRLTSLSLKNLAVDTLPESLGNLQDLESLYVHACTLTSVPGSVLRLPKLKSLTLDRTEIKELPGPTHLPELMTLRLEGNLLKTLPESLVDQPKLKTLYLKDNPWEYLPQALGDARYTIELPIGEKQRLLDFSYKGADGKGVVTWDDTVFYAQNDKELIAPVAQYIADAGLDDCKEALLALTKRAIGFTMGEEDTYGSVGSHRFGGYPDLPQSIPYPKFYNEYKKKELAYEFIAQINCTDIAPLQAYLPRTGLLYFFLTTHHGVYGGSRPAKVIWHPGGTEELTSGKTLDFTVDDFFEAMDVPPYTPYMAQAFAINSLPDLYAYDQNAHWFKVKGGEALYKKLEEEDSRDTDRLYDILEEPVNKLYPHDFAMNGYMFTQHESPELQASLALKGDPEDWIILLKVASRGDFQWGDAGDLAFVIHKSDLAQGHFGNVFCTLESS